MHDKRPDIQGLRAWAVISVVIFHFFPSLLPYGYLGVDVFFVLSGFLITLVLEGRPTSISTYYNFYFKRLRRILPLALLIIFLCVLAIAYLQSDYEFTNGMKSALYSTFFVKNMQPHPSLEDDYFQQLENANDFFTHYWSLCVEIQFYLLAPIILHLCKPSTDKAMSSFSFMVAVSAGSLLYFLLSNPQGAFDFTPARLWQFLAGAMAFHSDLLLSGRATLPDNEKEQPEETTTRQDRKKAIFIPAAFAVVASVAVLYTGDLENVLRFATTFVTALVLALRSKSACLCHLSLQLIGDVSYSLYLIHWPVVCVLDIFEIEEWHWKYIAMMVAFALSVVCHFAYEKRYLTLSTQSTLFLVVALYVAIFAAIGTSFYLNLQQVEQESNGTLPPLKLDLNQKFVELSQAEIDRRNAKLSRDNSLRYSGCTIQSGRNPIGFCDLKASLHAFYLNGNGSLHFLILGNSYAANLGGLIVKHFRPHYGKLQARAIAQCEPLVPTRKDRYCPDYRTAHAKFDADIDRERPDVLFVVARFIHPDEPIDRPIEKDTVFRIMENRLKYFEERVNKKVFILQAFPRPARANTLEKKMKEKGLPMQPYMPEAVEVDPKLMRERVEKLAERCKKCVIFDIEDFFLNEAGNFTVLNPQKLRYFDQARHLNSIGRQLVEPEFERLAGNFTRLLDSRYPDNIFE